jgi:hypothetical protein
VEDETPERAEDVDDYLRDCVRIEPMAIQEEFVRMPADYAFWNERYRTALEAHLLAEAERERVWAGLFIIESQKANPATGKPASIEYAKAAVEGSNAYREVVADAIRAQAERERVRGILEALRTKRDSLVSLGAMVRQEMQHDPTVRTKLDNDRIQRSVNER